MAKTTVHYTPAQNVTGKVSAAVTAASLFPVGTRASPQGGRRTQTGVELTPTITGGGQF